MSQRGLKPITKWLKDHKGLNLRYISKISKSEYGIDVTERQLYHFTKGITRNEKVENLFLKIGVPKDKIEKTFSEK